MTAALGVAMGLGQYGMALLGAVLAYLILAWLSPRHCDLPALKPFSVWLVLARSSRPGY
jgi:hypothetical protein